MESPSNKIGMKKTLTLVLVVVLLGCSNTKKTTQGEASGTVNGFISFADPHIQYEGRVGLANKEAAELYWPGTTVRLVFEGTGITAFFKDSTGQAYLNVIIDGDSIHRIRVDTVKKAYVLASNLRPGRHTIELFKRTQIHKEYKRGFVKFFGFQLEEDSKVFSPPPLKKRKMEFYGNSITCGHAIEDTSGGDSGASIYENNYLSYGALTARHFGAQYSCIAKSGIGVMVSFGSLIMPEMYKLRNPFDSTDLWDFSKYVPDIVVVNLFQNDGGIVKRPEYVEFKRRFGTKPPDENFIVQSYSRFIAEIRGKYPKANIICSLGSMSATEEGSAWPGYVQKAVNQLNDQKIFTHFFKYKNTPGHPRVSDHKIMAESLIRFIDTHIKW